MIYLLYGVKNLIDTYINKIKEKEKIEDINISKYSFEDTLDSIIEDANTMSMFSSKKIIIVENDLIFSSKKNIDTSNIEKYIKNYNPNTILIFVIYTDTVDSRKKIYKLINEYGKIEQLTNVKNINEYVKKLFQGYQISNNTINLFINRVGNNLDRLYQEANKIMIYKINDKLITDNDILECTREKIDINIFSFIDSIVNKDKYNSLKSYKEMIRIGEEPIKIIVMLSNQFRLMYQTKMLRKKGYNEDDISSILNVKKYPVHLAIQKSMKYTDSILLKYLEELADLDIKIKSGEIDKNFALELFLIKL